MSRSCGCNAVTSRSPIMMRPPVGVSSPAIILSAVLFPHPDGPTSTMNSPSRISRSSPFAATWPLGYVLVTPSRRTEAMLAFHRSSCESLDDAPLECQHEQRHRKRCDDRGRQDLPPRDLVLAPEES